MVLNYEIKGEFDATKRSYEGVLLAKDGEVDVFKREVSILPVCSVERLNTMAACADRMRRDREPHSRVCPLVFQDMCDKITSDRLVPIVAVDPFDGFVDDIDRLSEDVGCQSQKLYEDFAYALKNPRNHPKAIPRNLEIPKVFIPGCPKFLIGSEVRALLIELGNLVKCGVFPSDLHKLSSYVVKAGKIYFLKVDLLKSDYTDEEWNEIIREGLTQFGALVRFLLRGFAEKWLERDCILDCFKTDLPYHKDHIFMAHTHPFWKGDVFKLLNIFIKTFVKSEATIYRNRPLFNIMNLRRGVRTKQIKRQIFPTETSWYDDKTATGPIAAFVRQSKEHPESKDGDTICYTTESPDDFHRFSRHWVSHSTYHPFNTYEQIMLNWPRLIHIFHQLLCGFLDADELEAADKRELEAEKEALESERKRAEDEDMREQEAFWNQPEVLESLRKRKGSDLESSRRKKGSNH